MTIRKHLSLLSAVLLGTLSLAGCGGGVLDPAGPVGQQELVILIDSLAIMLVIVVPTILCTLGFAFWYRASNTRASYAPRWSYSGRLELLVWSIPALVVCFLSGIAWTGSHALDPAQPLSSERRPLEVQVVSLDWKWLFIYPQEHIASVNELVIPAGTPVHFRLTSASVMNVFFVPRLGSEIYTMNGMVTELNLAADKPGTFPGLAAHFNGDGFSDMHFKTRAIAPEAFSAWIASTRAAGPQLDETTYRELLHQSVIPTSYTYRSVASDLFDEITAQHLPQGEGPRLAELQQHIHRAAARTR